MGTRLYQRGLSRRQLLMSPLALWSGVPPRLPSFTAIGPARGIQFHHRASHTPQKYLIETMGSGVAMFDYDNDGRLDLFFVNGARLQDPMPSRARPGKTDPQYWNRLYHNNGDGTFSDVTEKAGLRGHSYGMGVAVGDYDNDGFSDLYVTNFGQNILYHNNGDGTFTDVTPQAGVAAGGWSTSACFVDYNRDGRLDLLVTRYLDWDFSKNTWCGEERSRLRAYCHPIHFRPATHILYHNNGDGTFTDVSRQSGIGATPGKGLGVAIEDFDADGWSDLLIANDNWAQQLFRNRHDGTFEEIGAAAGLAFDDDGQAFAGMGVDFADYDNDGKPDVFIDALGGEKYALFRNTGRGFEYVSRTVGVGAITLPHSGWGAKFIDYDNDGWKDLFVAQGHVMDNIEVTDPALKYREPLLMMRNVNGRFQDVSGQCGAAFQIALAARGAAFGDLDNDGCLDIAVNCNDGPAVVLRNQGGSGNHWLMINTIGSRSNRDGIGAKLRLISESGQEQHAMVSTASSYLSASDKRVHFGLGKDRRARLIEIHWPSGAVQRLEEVAADQILTVRESSR